MRLEAVAAVAAEEVTAGKSEQELWSDIRQCLGHGVLSACCSSLIRWDTLFRVVPLGHLGLSSPLASVLLQTERDSNIHRRKLIDEVFKHERDRNALDLAFLLRR